MLSETEWLSTMDTVVSDPHERGVAAHTLRSHDREMRAEIEKELDGSKAVLEETSGTSVRVAGAASRLLVDLARAVETGATDAEGPPPTEACPPPSAKNAKKGAASLPRGRAPKPPASQPRASAPAPAASPAPAAKPARKGKPSDDFEP